MTTCKNNVVVPGAEWIAAGLPALAVPDRWRQSAQIYSKSVRGLSGLDKLGFRASLTLPSNNTGAAP